MKCKSCGDEVKVTCLCGYCLKCIACYGHDNLHIKEIQDKLQTSTSQEQEEK